MRMSAGFRLGRKETQDRSHPSSRLSGCKKCAERGSARAVATPQEEGPRQGAGTSLVSWKRPPSLARQVPLCLPGPADHRATSSFFRGRGAHPSPFPRATPPAPPALHGHRRAWAHRPSLPDGLRAKLAGPQCPEGAVTPLLFTTDSGLPLLFPGLRRRLVRCQKAGLVHPLPFAV